MEGVDYSTDRPSGLCLYSQGKRFAARYFGPGSSGKHATRTEVSALLASGLAVVCYAEGAELDPLQGFNMGRSHAQSAANAVHAAGIPDDRPIYFAVDFNASVAQLGKVASYFNGVASVIGWPRAGAYGGYPQLVWLNNNTGVTWFNQTSSWSNGKWFLGNHLEQYEHGRTVCGARCDLLRSRKTDYGQHPKPGTSGGSPPTVPPDTTVATPWEFTDTVRDLASLFDDVRGSVAGSAAAIESWSH